MNKEETIKTLKILSVIAGREYDPENVAIIFFTKAKDMTRENYEKIQDVINSISVKVKN